MLARSINRISSGIRVQNASDDAGSLGVSQGIASDLASLKQGSRNLTDAISLVKTAEGGLGEVSAMLIRLREISSQSATGTVGQRERGTLQLEFAALTSEIDRMANTTEFNGQKVIEGSLASTATQHIVIQSGSNTTAQDRIDLNSTINLTAVTTSGLGLTGINISDMNSAVTAMGSLAQAIQALTNIRGRIGAAQNVMERNLSNQDAAIENLTAANSTLTDADMAQELAGLTKNQILTQASSAMVGQANLIPQSVLSLLRQGQ
jgi:flagellin